MTDAGLPEGGLGEWQELLLGTDTLQDFLGEVAAASARDFGGDVSCGVTVRTHERRPTTLGTSDSFAATLDEVQYSEGQGPCLHALSTGEIITMLDIAGDDRWPRFTELSAAQGARSSLSMPMATARTGVVGALNISSRSAHAFADAERDQAGRFAISPPAVAIGVRLAQRAELTEDLRTALSSRSTIDQALGIIMGQRRCDVDEAFSVLRHLSQTSNTKLREIAAQVIHTVTGAPPTPPAPVGWAAFPLR
jgi:hypothetical protein